LSICVDGLAKAKYKTKSREFNSHPDSSLVWLRLKSESIHCAD
jgi:hypothetical protein